MCGQSCIRPFLLGWRPSLVGCMLFKLDETCSQLLRAPWPSLKLGSGLGSTQTPPAGPVHVRPVVGTSSNMVVALIATNGANSIATNGARTLLGASGLTTRNDKATIVFCLFSFFAWISSVVDNPLSPPPTIRSMNSHSKLRPRNVAQKKARCHAEARKKGSLWILPMKLEIIL